MPSAPTPFHADGRWLDLVKHGLRQMGLAIALPLALYLMFKTPLSGVLAVAGVGLGLTALLTWGRLAWGRAIAFLPDGAVRVLRRDGSTLEIGAVGAVRIKRDCIVFAWQDHGKRRSLVIGHEGFAPATWVKVHAAAQAWQQQPATVERPAGLPPA